MSAWFALLPGCLHAFWVASRLVPEVESLLLFSPTGVALLQLHARLPVDSRRVLVLHVQPRPSEQAFCLLRPSVLHQ